jgi:hypothetical protein
MTARYRTARRTNVALAAVGLFGAALRGLQHQRPPDDTVALRHVSSCKTA